MIKSAAPTNSKLEFPKTSMHSLDNVIWQALTTRQTEFADSFGDARRFMREVTTLGGFPQPNDAGYESLAELVGPHGTVAVFLDLPYGPRPGWSVIGGAPLLQMVHENGGVAESHAGATHFSDPHTEIIPLGKQDSPEMVELATLTKPGPFGLRTYELGGFVGIRDNGKLVAMAGQRMKIPGYSEVSAVCTHPDYTGRGYAAALMMHVMRGIRDRGEVPFLHTRQDNARAIELYKRLGFRDRLYGHYVILRRE